MTDILKRAQSNNQENTYKKYLFISSPNENW